MNDHASKPNLTYIELFSGCGGLSLGLHKAGWEGIFAIERDPMAFETFNKNFLQDEAPYRGFTEWPSWLPKHNHDIACLLQNDIMRRRLLSLRDKVLLVAGGPPCQGFSVGGRRDGTDERNNLVFHMLELVELVQPKIVLIENVEGIAKKFVAKPGEASTSVVDLVLERLSCMGYEGTYSVVNASDFGVPQARKRVVILGVHKTFLFRENLKKIFLENLEHSKQMVRDDWGLPKDRLITAGEAIRDLFGGEKVRCPDSQKYESITYIAPESAFAKSMRKRCKNSNVPNSHRFSVHGARILELYKIAHATQPPGRLTKAFLLENNTKKDKKVLIDENAIVSTITTHPDEFIHFAEPRNITVREMARLQSFPDDFHFYGRYTINGPRRKHDVARCSQVGNAVPPLMAQGIGYAVAELATRMCFDKQSENLNLSKSELSEQLRNNIVCSNTI